MDERIKFFLLANRAGAAMSTAVKFLSLGVPLCELWRPAKIDAAATVFTEAALAAVRRLNAENWAEAELERAAAIGASIVTAEDERYPRPLMCLTDMPPVLYIKGKIDAVARRHIGIVGTRRTGAYGKEAAKRIGAACARCGISVISGGAWGVDGIAQSACCAAGGASVAVLGTGVDVVYPASNKKLFDELQTNGALVSEFPLGAKGEPWHFPKRNRIVAAMSEKLIVVEAPIKSGSMITARLALDLGVEVWALPGHIYDENAQGTNRLIFDGAYPYISDEVFFSACGVDYSPSGRRPATQKTAGLEDTEKTMIEYLYQNGPKTIDNLAVEFKMSAADLLKKIAVLTAKGHIYMSSPGRYSAKNSL